MYASAAGVRYGSGSLLCHYAINKRMVEHSRSSFILAIYIFSQIKNFFPVSKRPPNNPIERSSLTGLGYELKSSSA
jgi:hypothetical protein